MYTQPVKTLGLVCFFLFVFLKKLNFQHHFTPVFCVIWSFRNRDVTINREPVENRFKYVTIQIGWDAKQIAIQLGVGVYMNVCLRGTYCL